MTFTLLTVPSAAARLLPAAPRLLARAAAPAVGAAAGLAAGTARAGVRTADATVRVARVAGNAMPGGGHRWRAGARQHLALRPADAAAVRHGMEQVARQVAAALAEHPDVLLAYWDEGLARLVVTATEERFADLVLERAQELAERHGLVLAAPEGPEEITHPADPVAVRVAATALAADVLGAGAALTAYALRLPPSPRAVTAAVTFLRRTRGSGAPCARSSAGRAWILRWPAPTRRRTAPGRPRRPWCSTGRCGAASSPRRWPGPPPSTPCTTSCACRSG